MRRVDPWAMLKVSLIASIVMFVVWMFVVAVLYLSFGSLGVWDEVNATYATLATDPGPLITANGCSSPLPFLVRSTPCCCQFCRVSPRFCTTPPQE